MKVPIPLVILIWISGFALGLPQAFGQISLTYPANRTVFQRDKNNSATIYIAGNFTEAVDRIEAQLVPVQGGNQSGWITIQANPQGGYFSGSIDWSGGWYTLEVRAWRGDRQMGSAAVSRVGVGEVFLIAGQSNAQGYQNYGGPGANDDRVNTINHYTNDAPGDQLPIPQFSRLDQNSFISPRGNSSWAWGRLGDQLANRLGVPILFYNAAWYGSAIRNWRESISGGTNSVWNGEPFPAGAPYGSLRLAMQHYVSVTGVRAVLWLQGESDNHANTSREAYLNDLRAIIQQSRQESGRNISWVVARTSYDGKTTDPPIIDAQNAVISTVSNVHAGPNTDDIQRNRPDGIHFQNEGLVQLGDAWNSSLTNDFFARSEPHKAQPLPRVVVSGCSNESNTLRLALEGNYTSVNWTSGTGDRTITAGPGTYRVRVRDANGNVLFSPEIRVPDNVRAATPAVSIDGRNPICQNGTTTLVAQSGERVQWNTGQTESRITVSTGGEYFATVRNAYGCEATSARVAVGVLSTPPPPTPAITITAPTTFCEGGEVVLQSSADQSVWSNGQQGKVVAIRSSGDYRVRAVDAQGCFSADSEPVTVRVNPLPARPTIAASGNTTFCQGGDVTLTSSYNSGNLWSNQSGSRSITVNQPGTFTVQVRDDNGCQNVSEPVTVRVNPLPAPPTITALRPTTFCDRDFTLLRASESNSYRWNTGSDSREVEVRLPGSYFLTTTDQNGCTSVASAAVSVVVNPLPARPSITAAGPTTFCADKNVVLQSSPSFGYQWSHGAGSREVSVSKTAEYSVQARNEFGCLSDPSNRIGITALPLPDSPTVTALGPTSFCAGDNVSLVASGNGPFLWNSGETTPAITVGQSGSYAAKIQGANGCLSIFSAAVQVLANPVPQKPLIRQAGTFTLEALNTLDSELFEWKRDETSLPETRPLLRPRQSGTYIARGFIVYSPTLTCASEPSDAFRFELDQTTGGLSIYPTPSVDGLVTLETLEDLPNAAVQLFDLRGNLIHTFSSLPLTERRVIDLSALPNGVYLLRMESGTFSAVKKIILAH
jgi:hypothetical protein